MDAYLKDQFDFTGVKAALLVEQSILVILRDNKPDIPWPNTWELPGGKSILVCWIKIGQLSLWLAELAKSSIVRFVLVTRGRNLN